jgi:predicted Zn-dependent protease with MMP-like domain
VDVSAERFEELVVEALDSIPPALGELMDNVAVFVEDRSRQRGLLGRYEGIPLTKREQYGSGGAGGYGGMVMPDRITVFREAILDMCATEAEVVEQVRITVVHEVAHHFGIGDKRLHELGWG